MRTFSRFLFVCLGMPALTVASLAQIQTAPGQQGEQKVVINAAEVPFDVVVRDRKGRPVTDLRASDFEVYEDGVAQQVNSFRLVTREQRGGGAETVGATPESPDSLKNRRLVTGRPLPGGAEAGPHLSAVAIFFDRLTPDGRADCPKVIDRVAAKRQSAGPDTG